MESGMESIVQPGTAAWNHPRGRSWGRPCTRACMRPVTDAGMESGTERSTRSAARQGRCPLGFSDMQIAILSVLKAHPPVIAHWQIAESVTSGYGLAATEGMVRGALERLLPRGFLVRTRAARGRVQGNRYVLSPEPCPYILQYGHNTNSGMEPSTEPATQSSENGPLSILKEKKERKNLSISSEEDASSLAIRRLEALTEDDLAFHWPNLAKVGFGTCQIRQIIGHLTKVNISLEKIIQGLNHADWELETGTMRDKSGAPVASPVDWVFTSLSRNGYYRRPAGYVSPQEQAELDAAEEAKRRTEACEARQKAEFDAWSAVLLPEERATITAPPGAFSMPEDTALRLHFKSHVWPKILAGRMQKEGSHEA